MTEKSSKEKIEEAKKIYHLDAFRAHMRGMQGFTDEDFEKITPIIKTKIINSKETNPLEMFENILHEISLEWKKPTFPVHADWHHFMVPGVIMASLRNCGYSINDKDIEEAMMRGEKFMGGSCGFAGTCGGAYSVGIILSIVKKTTPLHENERSDIMQAVAGTLHEIAQYPRRCCKRSSYTSIQMAVKHLNDNGYEKISCGTITCRWSSQNKMCLGMKCPFFQRKP
jgi:hypothetical protein